MDFTKEDFDRFLTWLDPDPEKAALRYTEVHHSLAMIFTARGCDQSEELADEAINRVAHRLEKMIDTYEGPPYPYLVRVANNLASEHKGKTGKITSLPEDFYLETQSPDEELEQTFACLDRCMEKLHPTKRQLVLEYYQENKKAKIERRKKIAASLDIPINALRIRMCRTRDGMRECVLRCLKGDDSTEID